MKQGILLVIVGFFFLLFIFVYKFSDQSVDEQRNNFLYLADSLSQMDDFGKVKPEVETKVFLRQMRSFWHVTTSKKNKNSGEYYGFLFVKGVNPQEQII